MNTLKLRVKAEVL